MEMQEGSRKIQQMRCCFDLLCTYDYFFVYVFIIFRNSVFARDKIFFILCKYSIIGNDDNFINEDYKKIFVNYFKLSHTKTKY